MRWGLKSEVPRSERESPLKRATTDFLAAFRRLPGLQQGIHPPAWGASRVSELKSPAQSEKAR
jgi:hypothetical protein